MKVPHCEREQAVLDATRSGRSLDGALRNHVAGCAVCADVALVAEYLAPQGELARAEAALPNPGLIWWRAHVLARREAAERATQPIAIAQRVACASGIAALLVAVVLQWSKLHDWLVRHDWLLRSVERSRFGDVMAGLWTGPSNTVFVMGQSPAITSPKRDRSTDRSNQSWRTNQSWSLDHWRTTATSSAAMPEAQATLWAMAMG